MSLVDHFREIPFFSHWKDASWNALIEAGVPEERFPGSRILTEKRADQFALLVSGKLAAHLPTAYGPLPLGEIEPGEMLGMEAYVDAADRTTDYEVLDEIRLLNYSRQTLDSLSMRQDFRAAWLWTSWRLLSEALRRRNAMLPRFFATESAQSTAVARPAPGPAPELAVPQQTRVPIGEKRQLFEEKRLSGMVIQFLSTLSREERYAAGESIFHEGDAGDKMYVIAEGEVMISRRLPEAGQEAIDFLSRGDFFGEMALIDDAARSADASVRGGDAILLSISRDVLGGVLDVEKVSSLRLLEILCGLMAQRLRATEDKLSSWFVLAGGQIAAAEREILSPVPEPLEPLV